MNTKPTTSPLAERNSIEQVETGLLLAPKFDSHGLIPVITTDYADGEVLMHGYMNREAMLKTIASGEAHYWSRSRRCLWRKGDHSGFVQKVKEMRIDDDQDAVWLRVEVSAGGSCHVGYRSCFYRAVALSPAPTDSIALQQLEQEKVFDPNQVYKDSANPTQL